MKILGYADQISATPGSLINFMISTEAPEFEAALVRFTGGPDIDNDYITPQERIDVAGLGKFPGRVQTIDSGSYARLPLPPNAFREGEICLQCWLCPTLPECEHPQVIFELAGELTLRIDGSGILELSAGGSVCRSEAKLRRYVWYFVAAQWAPELLELHLHQTNRWTHERHSESKVAIPDETISVNISHLMLAGSDEPGKTFNGKIERPCVFSRALNDDEMNALYAEVPLAEIDAGRVVAEWDFNQQINTDRVVNLAATHLNGKLIHAPMRGCTGHLWDGKAQQVRDNPDHYNAAHFHEDDVADAGWQVDVSLILPDDLRSGAYALEVTVDGGRDLIPFFARPDGESDNDVLFLAPTNTYFAYANEQLADPEFEAYMAGPMLLHANDEYIYAHPEIGKSNYDTHPDGSGVVHSSRLRPVLNMRPYYRTWITGGPRHLAADLYIVGWLEQSEFGFDVATDEDLHQHGRRLLNEYKVLVTGSHPEYWTRAMMDSLRDWLLSGGRLLYLGGNGFYWVTGATADAPHIIEVRRATSGTRSWDSAPGELYLTTTGDLGGLWRHAGYSPQELVGVGFAAEGWGMACGYRRSEVSPADEAFFAGIDDEILGDFGYVLGGAVGDEVDRLDFALGTPENARRLATSVGLDDSYQLVHEDMLMTLPGMGGAQQEKVRADIVTFDVGDGGKVFSVGSINYAGALAWNNYDNNIARLTTNALRLFLNE